MKYIITTDKFTSELFTSPELVEHEDIIVISEQRLAKTDIEFEPDDIFYVASESSHHIVLPRIKDSELRNALAAMKDKFKFRQMLSSLYPDFFFAKTKIEDLEKLDLDRSKSYVLKPVQGFFATGIEFIEPNTDLAETKLSFQKNMSERGKYFSDGVFSTDVLVEERLMGTEIACDMFFDADGRPQILNISAHPVHNDFAYMHTLYQFNPVINKSYKSLLANFFKSISAQISLRNVAFHAEFISTDSGIFPVEMNALRYGGFGYADTTKIFFDLNPLLALFDSEQVDYQPNASYAWVLAYNGKNMDKQTQKPAIDKFLRMFSNVLHFHRLDYREYPAFGIAYVQESKQNLEKLLSLDFDEFSEPIHPLPVN